VNKIYVPNSLYFLITCICLVFFPKAYQQSWIKWLTSSVLTLRLNSQQLITSEKPYYGAINWVYYVMWIDFTERCHDLFNRVVESLLCFLHEPPVLLCKRYLLESKYFESFGHISTHQGRLVSGSAGLTNRSTGVAYL